MKRHGLLQLVRMIHASLAAHTRIRTRPSSLLRTEKIALQASKKKTETKEKHTEFLHIGYKPTGDFHK